MTCTCDPIVKKAHEEEHSLLRQLVSLSTVHHAIRQRYSKGDNWTTNDDRISEQLSVLDDVLTEKATALSIASARHKEVLREWIERTAEVAVD